ncbi:glycosyltransferase family 39 protein [Patulibacter sp. SYSU D01012]|uniref:glycosyltransferase family 39 protein n=1 Tax=Patulibacter sp. SYSU D01012 TaxID=2817381 RepID=UPI001B30911D|nr:glycosyltransferase family 39 protein [Patulibacter sp. SYSU D01012]
MSRPHPADAPSAARRPSRGRASLDRLRAHGPHVPVLVGLVAVGLLLRLWALGQNLPLVYNIDESARFVPDAATFFSHRLGYRELVNPPGLMGLLAVVDAAWFGVHGTTPREALLRDPGQAYLVGRVVVALLSTAAIPVLYAAGRRLVGQTAALVAAGLLAVAFLPVAYSRLALSDGPTLLFLALGLLAGAWILEDGRTRGYVLAGIAVGLAAGFKYNAGIVVLVALAAALLRLKGDGPRRVVGRTALLGIVAFVAFAVADPYVLLDPHEMWRAIQYQQAWASGGRYVGEPMTSGWAFYAWAATWGVGWAPLVAGVVGAGLLAWRRPRVAVLLLPLVVLYLAIMGGQDRFFARWLLPVVPVLCLTAGFAVAQAAALVRRRGARVALVAGLAVGLAAQSLVHSAHSVAVVGRQDTRTVLRDWMVEHVPPTSGVVLESMSPAAWMPTFDGAEEYWSLRRWAIYHAIPEVRRREGRRHPQLRVKAGFSSWVNVLYPGLLDVFERYGYCYVVAGSYQAGRAARTPELVPEAVRYYRELQRRGTLLWQVSPFRTPSPDGRPWGPLDAPVPYQIDRQATTYELDYERPGPIVSVYRLHGGRCAAADPVVPNAPWR